MGFNRLTHESYLEARQKVIHVMVIFHHNNVLWIFLLLRRAPKDVVENGVDDTRVSFVQIGFTLRSWGLRKEAGRK